VINARLLYSLPNGIVLLMVFAILLFASYFGFRLGALVESRGPEGNPYFLAEVVPSTILGLLTLILGFTFSMTVGRFENRRRLVIEEANAISTTYLRSKLLRSSHGAVIGELLTRYLDERIAYYAEDRKDSDPRLEALRSEIWNHVIEATRVDRGAIENGFVTSMNVTFDIGNARNIALRKQLPPMIYWSILFIAAMAMTSFNFARAMRGERGLWQPALLVLMISFVFCLILDIERPREGAVRITQDAMLGVRDSIR
jgi:hypothetical protein